MYPKNNNKSSTSSISSHVVTTPDVHRNALRHTMDFPMASYASISRLSEDAHMILKRRRQSRSPLPSSPSSSKSRNPVNSSKNDTSKFVRMTICTVGLLGMGITQYPPQADSLTDDELVTSLSALFDRDMSVNKHIAIPCSTHLFSLFYSIAPPAIQLKHYIERFIKYTTARPFHFLKAIVLMQRIAKHDALKVKTANFHRVFTAAFILVLEDSQYVDHSRMAKICGVPEVQELNKLKTAFRKFLAANPGDNVQLESDDNNINNMHSTCNVKNATRDHHRKEKEGNDDDKEDEDEDEDKDGVGKQTWKELLHVSYKEMDQVLNVLNGFKNGFVSHEDNMSQVSKF